jgi:hypothetical protein
MSLTQIALSHFSCCGDFFCTALMSAELLSRLSMQLLCMLSLLGLQSACVCPSTQAERTKSECICTHSKARVYLQAGQGRMALWGSM